MMMNRLFAVIGGIIAGFSGIMMVQFLSQMMYPLLEGFDMEDKAAMAELVKNASMGMLMMVLASYAFGSIIGGFVAAKINKVVTEVVIVGLILMGAGIWNLLDIPHPTWFWIASILTYPVFALIGGKMGGMRMQ